MDEALKKKKPLMLGGEGLLEENATTPQHKYTLQVTIYKIKEKAKRIGRKTYQFCRRGFFKALLPVVELMTLFPYTKRTSRFIDRVLIAAEADDEC